MEDRNKSFRNAIKRKVLLSFLLTIYHYICTIIIEEEIFKVMLSFSDSIFLSFAEFRFTAVVSHTFSLEETVLTNAGRAVFINHAFRAPFLPVVVAHEIVWAVWKSMKTKLMIHFTSTFIWIKNTRIGI